MTQVVHFKGLKCILCKVRYFSPFVLGILGLFLLSAVSQGLAEASLSPEAPTLSTGYTKSCPGLCAEYVRITPTIRRGNTLQVDFQRLAEAIRRAENSKAHPYGILARYKHTTPRQACLNTISSAYRRYLRDDLGLDFISFLQRTYAPLNDPRDTTGLNSNWTTNVTYFYNKLGRNYGY